MSKFFIAEDKRLKCGWRVGFFFVAQALLQLLAAMVVAAGIIIFIAAHGEKLSAANFKTHFDSLLIPIACGAMVVVYPLLWVFRRFIDRKSFISLGLTITKRTLLQAGIGIFLGIVSISVAILILYAIGSCKIEGFTWHHSSVIRILGLCLMSFLMMALVGLTEELIMRGYIMGNLLETMRPTSAILISSLLFLMMHVFSPELNLIGAINIFLAGILLGLAFFRTRNLWLPIGLHFGWNFAQIGLYSLPASGQSFEGLINVKLVGPELLTGGKFGLEGGLLGTFMTLALILIMLWWKKLASTSDAANSMKPI